MPDRPEFFERVRSRAAERWDRLEQDRELAAPWHQLFRQVQSPQHVVSELLQNADDAGATEASVCIEDGVFVFEHNGEDFTEDHFASLCRFGYSNKRLLHTIGFRGIGFKSTFSLGNDVRLFTPTLAMGFNRKRFTEPYWLDEYPNLGERTRIQVAVRDERRIEDVKRNLSKWRLSAESLLFFRNIRRLELEGISVSWRETAPGPFRNSHWMAIEGRDDPPVLHIQSEPEPFPEEALLEIREERFFDEDEDLTFPPAVVELVLGTRGGLYVVLPTGVAPPVPFACNAPFIQDPSRLKIKSPSISPTNRWLLARAGRLAAASMLEWVQNRSLPIRERAKAYGLFPDVDRRETSLAAVCATHIEIAFEATILNDEFLLTEAGKLVESGICVHLPREVTEVWPADTAVRLFDNHGREPLCRHVADSDVKKLANWELLIEVDRNVVAQGLVTNQPPKPVSWNRLLRLWAYLKPEFPSYAYSYSHLSSVDPFSMNIVPVQGSGLLASASQVVRLAGRRVLQRDEDLQFISQFVAMQNVGWVRFLEDQHESASMKCDRNLDSAVFAAHELMERLKLTSATDVNTILERVAQRFFDQDDLILEDCVRMTQIAAKLGATPGDSFRYCTRDCILRWPTDESVVYDENGDLEDLIPPELRDETFLHPAYFEKFGSCSRQEWLDWVHSNRSRLRLTVPRILKKEQTNSRNEIEAKAFKRGLQGELHYHNYCDDRFLIEDWDYEEDYWSYWNDLAESDETIWARIIASEVSQEGHGKDNEHVARFFHVGRGGQKKALTSQNLLPTWILRIRELKCLPDTHHVPYRPSELFRRTPETEALIDYERFVLAKLDIPATQVFLDRLGVNSAPLGPESLLSRLRMLAGEPNPPVHEVEKLYRRIDKLIGTGPTDDLIVVKAAFSDEALILADDGAWVNTGGVFITASEDDVPGAAVIRSDVNELNLWRRIGVASEPTPDLAVQWLQSLPSQAKLSPIDGKRVRKISARHAVKVWSECAHWLNLAGQWTPLTDLRFGHSEYRGSLPTNLFPKLRLATADFSRLPPESLSKPPFSELPLLVDRIEKRFDEDPKRVAVPAQHSWMETLGTELRRVRMADSEAETRIRTVAERLMRTSWNVAERIEYVPYIDGEPVGIPQRDDAVWKGEELWVRDLPEARLAKLVPRLLAREFDSDDIAEALIFCFGRSPGQVRDYLNENFELEPVEDFTSQTTIDSTKAPTEPLCESPKSWADRSGSESFPDDEAIEEEFGFGEPLPGATDWPSGAPDPIPQHQDHDSLPPKVSASPTPQPKPSLMERFALAKGFQGDGGDRFRREDGSWIGRANGSYFPWEQRTSNGEVVRYYWPKEHCLESKPLELAAEIWDMAKSRPDLYALVLEDTRGLPVEVTGARLGELVEQGAITLYLASYRLVFKGNHDS